MKVLIFTTICLTLSALAQSIEENDQNQMITVYKTVTASNYVSIIDEIQNKEAPTASSSSEQAKPTMEDEPATENESMAAENIIYLNDDTIAATPIPDIQVEMEMQEEEEEEGEKDSSKSMRAAPEIASEKEGGADNHSSMVVEMAPKSASRSVSAIASGSVSASKDKYSSSSSSASSYSSVFSFSPITLAPESTKSGGAKATATVMNKVSTRKPNNKKDKQLSSSFRVVPDFNFILFIFCLYSIF